MPVKSIGTYDFPSKSRQELYGDDQLVHVWWADNPWFCAASTHRVPRAMTFGDFYTAVVVPWMESDPDFDPATEWSSFDWGLLGEPFTPDPAASLEDLGVGHKHYLSVRSAS